MKLLRFQAPCTRGAARCGIVEGDRITLLKGGPLDPAEPTRATCALAEVERFLPPVDPPNIIALGLNYRRHAEESKMAIPGHPLLFLKAATSACGHGESIVLPAMAPGEVDYEAELAIVIGRRAKNVAVEDARRFVLGYTCANDVSARDCQLRYDTQWARGKSFDTFSPLGPWIVTDVEPNDRRLRSRLNGTVMQDSTTADLIFNCDQLVSFLSRCMTLLPGTVIMTGTPSGVGFARKPPVFLRPGDTIEIEIDGIGVLANGVVSEA